MISPNELQFDEDLKELSRTNSASSIDIPEYLIDKVKYMQVVRQKRMVLNEIRSKDSSSESGNSDSEREAEINREMEELDRYGVTPPREIQRLKKKFNKVTQHFPLRKNNKTYDYQNNSATSMSLNNSSMALRQKERDNERKAKNDYNDSEYQRDLGVPRASKLVRVNSSKNLKSISHQKRNVDIEDGDICSEEVQQSVISRAMRIDSGKDFSKSSRHHFYKSFSLLVKLGGRIAFNKHHEAKQDVKVDEHWQVEYNELLWLELQAWQSGRSIEEEDNRLQEERYNVDSVINDVINFKFEDLSDDDDNEMKSDSSESDYIVFKHSTPAASTPRSNEARTETNEPFNGEVSVTPNCCSNDIQSEIEAMKDIIEILRDVDRIEKLYPSQQALVNAHSKYKGIQFVRNYEALVCWLNMCKDLFHTVSMIAEWIGIDVDDPLVWNDWFLFGLAKHCVRAHQSFNQTKYCTGNFIDSLENSNSSNIHRRSRRMKNTYHHHSYIETTSTSRYRPFVERELRRTGLFGIMVHVKDMLKPIIANFDYAFYDSKNKHIPDVSAEKSQMIKILNIINSLSTSPVEAVESAFARKVHGNGNQYAKACQEMSLPSFIDHYLFIIQVPIDLILESIRYRLDYRSNVDPSHHSIRQLIHESKEVLAGGVLAKYYYKMSVIKVIEEDDISKCKEVMGKLEEFEEDLKSMLNLYFKYLQTWFRLIQKMNKASENLKTVMDTEWNFCRDICRFVDGGEAQAAYIYCTIASDLLKSSGQFLEDSVDQCFSKYNPQEDNAYQRQKLSSASREYKVLLKEVRERTATALGFAKLLRKDLGITAKYDLVGTVEQIFTKLKASLHIKIGCETVVDYFIFAPLVLANRKKQCKHLINLIRGFDDLDDRSWCPDGYILLIKKPQERFFWKGKRSQLNLADDSQLLNIEVSGMVLICSNSFHLNSQRKTIEKIFTSSIAVHDEQTSSNKLIESSLDEMNNSACWLADIVISAVSHISQNLGLYSATEMDEADRNYTRKTCVETMHICFSMGFEYLREMVRLFTKHRRPGLARFFLSFSKMWVTFVMTKTERGKGARPRWAAQGMEFLIAAIDPGNLEQLSGDEFQKLKFEMQACIQHIIGQAEPKRQKPTKESQSHNSLVISRSRSFVPARKISDEENDKHRSLPSDFHGNVLRVMSDTTLIRSADNSSESLIESFSVEEEEEEVPPMVRVRTGIKEIEERRTAKLQHMRVIGNVTYKKADFASELVQMNVRRVQFKWQLGNKIGEGQFGKVYSCVNLDTGDLMAMKQIRFNPNDYGTIQSIADEITNIQSVVHESLVKYFGVEVHKDEMLIFMEYCADGTIAEIAKLGLPESMIRVYTCQIVQAVHFLHQNGVIHRDIKGANIFLSSSGLIKIGDFGCAVKLKDVFQTLHGEVFNTQGTAAYMAPEVITLDKGRGYGRAADIWSLGCVVVEMATGKQPWSEFDNIYAILFKVGEGHLPTIPDALSEEGKHFLRCCFIHDQHSRWTAAMLEGHQFVKINNVLTHSM